MSRDFSPTILALAILFGFQFSQASEGPYDLDGRFGFGIGGGIHESVGDSTLKNFDNESEAYAAWFRYHLSSAWSLEFTYDHLGYKDYSGLDSKLKNNPLTLSAGYRAWATERSRLLFQFGAGVMKSSNILNTVSGSGTSDNDAFGVKLRLGYEFMFGRDWALNVNADYHYAKLDQEDPSAYGLKELQIVSPMIGLTYYFGNGEDSTPSDSDGDGVSDDKDKCPGTVEGTKTGADGCAVKKEVTVVDSDYDGVADTEDKCPASKMGTQVNALGCAADKKLEFKLNVKFASGKSEVSSEAKTALAEFAAFMKKHPNTKAEIAGHTDNTGKESFNNSISKKRAESVRQYLIANFQISKDRLTAKGYGPSEPVGDNDTAEGRLANRRVVATIQTDE